MVNKIVYKNLIENYNAHFCESVPYEISLDLFCKLSDAIEGLVKLTYKNNLDLQKIVNELFRQASKGYPRTAITSLPNPSSFEEAA